MKNADIFSFCGRLMRNSIILVAILCNLLFTSDALATSGRLDSNFHFDGRLVTTIGSSDEKGHAVAIQEDGKIVVAGWTDNGSNKDIAVVRYATSGELDPTFDSDGIVTTAIGSGDEEAFAVAIQSDGKIVVAGYMDDSGSNKDFLLVRYTTTGGLDPDFDTDGIETNGYVYTDFAGSDDQINAIAIQSDDKIVVAGITYDSTNIFALARYDPGGHLDTSFSGDGILTTDVNGAELSDNLAESLVIQSDNKIIAAGTCFGCVGESSAQDFVAVRYGSTGELDTTFDSDGIAFTDFNSGTADYCYAAALQSDDKIVLAGRTYDGVNLDNEIALVRYNTNGSPDTGFGIGGKVITDIAGEGEEAYALAIHPDGKILTAGYSEDGVEDNFSLVRYTTTGILDKSFGKGGVVITSIGVGGEAEVNAIALQPSDGNIVVAGFAANYTNYDIGVARYLDEFIAATPADFDGDFDTDVSFYRPSTGRWFIKDQYTTTWGTSGDLSVPGDYDGDGSVDVAVYRPSTGKWFIKGQYTAKYGTSTDVPVPGDYNGDGTTDIAIFRPSTGKWFIKGQYAARWGTSADIPIPGDYNGDGVTDIAIYRPATGKWFIKGQFAATYGQSGDIPVPGDYNGNGTLDVAIFRPSVGKWFIKGQYAATYGQSTDIPVPGDYDDNGTWDVAIYRPSNGTWYVKGQYSTTYGGSAGDFPLPVRDTNADGDPYQ